MEMYGGQFGEFVFGYWGLKGKKTGIFSLLLSFVVNVTKSIHAERDGLNFLREETV